MISKKFFLRKLGLIVYLILILLIIFILSIKKTEEEYIPTEYERELIEYFKEIALNTEYDDNPQKIIKWSKPMFLFVYNKKGYKDQMKAIEKTIKSINKLTEDGFKIKLINDASKSNAILYLGERDEIEKLDSAFFNGIDEDFVGLADIEFEWENYSITNVKIFIDTSEPLEIQESAILEEITQSIGLINDSERHPKSIFYQNQIEDNIINKKYSKKDVDIIKLLYHPKMKSGLSSEQSEEVIKNILKKTSNRRRNDF